METTQLNKKKSYPWILLGGIVLIIFFLFLWGWIPRKAQREKIDQLAAYDPIPKVVIMEIKPNTNPIELILPSSAQAWHTTPIWARTNGYIIRYLVDIGDQVKEGDLLAEIDTPEVDQELLQAQAELDNSIALFGVAKITSDRWQKLWDKNREAVTKQEVDLYNGNTKAAEATVISNQKNVARLNYLKQFQEVYAPFDGTITQRSIDIGSLILGNLNETPQELFQIVDTHLIRFFVQVPQNYFRQVKVGLEAEVTIREFPEKIFKGTVTRYAKALDPNARTLLTEVDVENRDRILYPGLYGRVKFFMHPDTINFIIPTTAIIIHSGFPHVAVVDENQIVHLKRVNIGRDYGKEMGITLGLNENDRIVTIPSDQIQEGTKVEIIEKVPQPRVEEPSLPPA